ncbi:hypothetical protein BXZ70DRAFT_1005772 [Cristinia sonorae]|uniref:DUF6533 domain-containing protein n=1 Tax=Cristinia sonorae TaxID=1940300 RepID=A0A8K0UV44_9AGAR|nr:hypothetical protein BXZ70DRAFT_1005772 [Cristinia sonorae]
MSLQQLFANALSQVLSVRCSELASSTIVIYDHLATLDVEVDLIWRSGWSTGKCLFLLNRYYTLCAVLFNNYVLFSPNLTAELRIYALYFLDKRVLVLMGATFIAAVAASSTLMALSLIKITAVSNVIPGVPFCVPLELPKTFYAFWIPLLISETLLCGLALWRGLQNYLSRKSLYQSGRRLVEILIRDSFLYFLVLFPVYLTNTIIFIIGTVRLFIYLYLMSHNGTPDSERSAQPSQLESAIGYSAAMSCVMGNRLCLNVRGMLHNAADEVRNRTPGSKQDVPAPVVTQGLARSPSSRPTRSGRCTPTPSVVVLTAGSDGTVLTEIEMDELRDMRAARVLYV